MKLRPVIAALVAVAAIPLSPAHADPAELVAAAQQNAMDKFFALHQYTNYFQQQAGETAGSPTAPNVTCSHPDVAATQVTAYQDAVVADVHQVDAVLAHSQCVDLQRSNFTARLTATIQYCRWTPTNPCEFTSVVTLSDTAVSKNGIATPVVSGTYSFTDGSSPVGRVRRVYVCVEVPVGICRTYDYSNVYGGSA